MRLCDVGGSFYFMARLPKSKGSNFLSEDFLEKCSRPQQHHHIRVCANQTRSLATRVAIDETPPAIGKKRK
jgi:hypothetical protein